MSDITDLGKRLAELDAKADSEDWGLRDKIDSCYVYGSTGSELGDFYDVENADLIVTLRNAMPTLLRALAVMEAIPDRLGYGQVAEIAKRADEILNEWKR